MKKALLTSAIAAAVLALSVPARADIIVDLFSTLQPNLIVNNVDPNAGSAANSQVSDLIPPSIIGNYRDLGIVCYLGCDPTPQFEVVAKVGVIPDPSGPAGDGKLVFSNEDGVASTAVITWDGANLVNAFGSNVDTAGLGGIDLGDPSSQFNLDILFADQGFEFTLKIWTDATHWSQLNIVSTSHPSPATTAIPFAAFLDCTNSIVVPGVRTTCGAGGAVDFSSVGAMQAFINVPDTFGGSGTRTVAVDLSLDQVTIPVPEPGSLALAGLGMLALGAIRRRRAAQ